MAKDVPAFALDDEDRKAQPLTEAERAAVRRAEADIKAGRVHSDADIAKWLRKRAAEIVGRAKGPAKSR